MAVCAAQNKETKEHQASFQKVGVFYPFVLKSTLLVANFLKAEQIFPGSLQSLPP